MKTTVLNTGYVELIDTYGSDERVIETARTSTNKGFLGWDRDLRLLRYLLREGHWSCFEQCGATFELEVPIFVARQLMRHKSIHFNEASARYGALPENDWLPSLERVMVVDTVNKQAAGTQPCGEYEGYVWIQELKDLYARAQWVYERGIEIGVPSEIARCANTVSRFTKIRMTGNLRDLCSVMRQRLDSHAQLEIQEVAQAMHSALANKFPRTLAAFDEQRSVWTNTKALLAKVAQLTRELELLRNPV